MKRNVFEMENSQTILIVRKSTQTCENLHDVFAFGISYSNDGALLDFGYQLSEFRVQVIETTFIRNKMETQSKVGQTSLLDGLHFEILNSRFVENGGIVGIFGSFVRELGHHFRFDWHQRQKCKHQKQIFCI